MEGESWAIQLLLPPHPLLQAAWAGAILGGHITQTSGLTYYLAVVQGPWQRVGMAPCQHNSPTPMQRYGPVWDALGVSWPASEPCANTVGHTYARLYFYSMETWLPLG